MSRARRLPRGCRTGPPCGDLLSGSDPGVDERRHHSGVPVAQCVEVFGHGPISGDPTEVVRGSRATDDHDRDDEGEQRECLGSRHARHLEPERLTSVRSAHGSDAVWILRLGFHDYSCPGAGFCKRKVAAKAIRPMIPTMIAV